MPVAPEAPAKQRRGRPPKAGVSDHDREWLRWRAMTDLYFLCKEVLGYRLLTEETHRELCDAFVHKDSSWRCAACGAIFIPDLVYQPGLRALADGTWSLHPNGQRARGDRCECGGLLRRRSIPDQDAVKERLIFFPRGGFKSSIDVGDIVQWILNFPAEVTIQLLTGDEDLAFALQGEAVAHFVRKETVSDLQALFPELCVASDRGTTEEFVCPLRKASPSAAGKKDPTLRSSSLLGSAAGWHPWIMKFDDPVTETNSESEYMLGKICDRRNAVRPLLRIGGYTDQIGTTYDASDANCTVLREAMQAAGMEAMPDWGRTQMGDFAYFARPAWELTPEAKAKGLDKPERLMEIKPGDVKLLFPVDGEGNPAQTFEFLAKMRAPSRQRLLWAQYLLNPYAAAGAVITRAEIDALRVPWTQLPQPTQGYTVLWWDLAYSKPGAKWVRDYTVGVYAQVVFDRLFVLKIVRGKFLPDDTAHQIVAAQRSMQADRLCIEDTLGSRYLMNEMSRQAETMQLDFRPEFVTIDVTEQAKLIRYNELQPLVRTKRLLFSDQLDHWSDTVDEMTQFRTIRHKDIADAIGQIRQKFMSTSVAVRTQAQVDEDLRRKDAHDRAYGLGIYAPVVEEPAVAPAPEPAAPWGLEDILGGLRG